MTLLSGQDLPFAARLRVARHHAESFFRGTKQQLSLLTDFGVGDEAIYGIRSSVRHVSPNVRIEDICHDVPLGGILVGAWRLKRAVSLPTEKEGFGYIVVIDPGVGSERKGLAIMTKTGKYLVGPDNGVLSLAFLNEGIETAVEIENRSLTLLDLARSNTFHGKDVFAPIAAHLIRGVPITEVGKVLDPDSLVKIKISSQTSADRRAGYLVDVDGFGSIRTNMPNHLPEDLIGEVVPATIEIGEKRIETNAKVVRTFAEAKEGEQILVPSSTGFIDLAISLRTGGRLKNASEVFGITPREIALDGELRPAGKISLALS